MFQVGMDLKDALVQPHCPGQGQLLLHQVASSSILPDLGWDIQNLSRPPVPVSTSSQ